MVMHEVEHLFICLLAIFIFCLGDLSFSSFFFPPEMESCSGWYVVMRIQLAVASDSWAQAIHLLQLPWDYRCTPPCLANF